MKTDEIFVASATAFFLAYLFLVALEIYISIAIFIFILSPGILIALFLGVLRYGTYHGPEFAEGQEFGYFDKPHLGKSTLTGNENS